MPSTLHGKEAVKKAKELYGDALTSSMANIIMEEGYSSVEYKDSNKKVKTVGFGQTGVYKNMPFPEVFNTKEKELGKILPTYKFMPEYLQQALMSSHYRGALLGSPKTLALIKNGKYLAASSEYLNNKEYRDARKSGSGVAPRMEREAAAIRQASKDLRPE